jgi:hypothetical protein
MAGVSPRTLRISMRSSDCRRVRSSSSKLSSVHPSSAEDTPVSRLYLVCKAPSCSVSSACATRLSSSLRMALVSRLVVLASVSGGGGGGALGPPAPSPAPLKPPLEELPPKLLLLLKEFMRVGLTAMPAAAAAQNTAAEVEADTLDSAYTGAGGGVLSDSGRGAVEDTGAATDEKVEEDEAEAGGKKYETALAAVAAAALTAVGRINSCRGVGSLLGRGKFRLLWSFFPGFVCLKIEEP